MRGGSTEQEKEPLKDVGKGWFFNGHALPGSGVGVFTFQGAVALLHRAAGSSCHQPTVPSAVPNS